MSSAASAGGSSAASEHLAIWIAVACSMAGVLMQALDTTIVNVALPYMQGTLSASRDQITWILTSYIVASAIFTAPVGWLANRFGARNVFIAALGGFTVASCLCGMATSMGEIVLFRGLQGAFGAALMPLSMSIMVALFPPEKRAGPMSLWGMGLMLGPIIGPTLGGYLTEYYSWRWCFYVNVPVGLLAMAGLWIFYHHPEDLRRVRFDWLGFGFVALMVGAFQLMLDRGTDQDWFSSGEIISYAVLAGLGAYLFLYHFITSKGTFIPRGLFLDRNMVLTSLLLFIFFAVLLSSLSLMPTFLQNVSDRPVLNAGLLMGPRGAGVMAAMLISGRIANRVDPRHIMTLGAVLMAWTLWVMARWPSYVGGSEFMIITIIQGFAMGLVTNPLMLIGFTTLSPALRNDGTMFVSLVRNISSAIGISVATVVLTDSMQTIRDQSVHMLTPFNQMLNINAVSKLASYQLPNGLPQLNGMMQAYVAPLAYGNAYMLLFWMSIACLPVIWMFRRPAYSMGGRAKARNASQKEV